MTQHEVVYLTELLMIPALAADDRVGEYLDRDHQAVPVTMATADGERTAQDTRVTIFTAALAV